MKTNNESGMDYGSWSARIKFGMSKADNDEKDDKKNDEKKDDEKKNETNKSQESRNDDSKGEPARLSYFFGPGYKDVSKAIKLLWKKNAADAAKYYHEYESSGVMSAGGLFNLFKAISIMTFGSLFSLIISLITVLVLVLCFVPVYLLFSLIWLIDRCYLVHNKISVSCSYCLSNFPLPIYECECGRRHRNLTPGKYGIWKRRCLCGRKLPTAFFNGRKELRALCPVCLEEGRITYLNDKETRPFCIPVIGGRSVGKTAFITAFSKQFIDEVAPKRDITVKFYDDATEKMYRSLSSSYMTGSTVMTQKVDNRTNTSAIDLSFFVKHQSLKPERLFHIYDIAGEVFTKNDENELPKHFTYSQGIIFIVDPFSLPDVRHHYEHLLGSRDTAGIGSADIDLIFDTFISKIKSVTGMADDEMSNIPLAVVISKTDSPGLKGEFSKSKIQEIKDQFDSLSVDDSDAQDYLCREFMKENGALNFIHSIDLKFKKVRFFAVSAIGHTRNEGMYNPKGVMLPAEWICSCTDKALASVWGVGKFTENNIILKKN
ncbi:MAG: hypothetical protein IJ861_10440 [Clostridia bacterium]|nr:hypothetical protein [Clostridia bacterium]